MYTCIAYVAVSNLPARMHSHAFFAGWSKFNGRCTSKYSTRRRRMSRKRASKRRCLLHFVVFNNKIVEPSIIKPE